MKKFNFFYLFALSFLLSGCYTYYPTRESSESFKIEKDEYMKIQKFLLKNGDSIDVHNFEVKYYEKYKIFEKVFVCIQLPTTEENQIFYKETKKEEKIIPLEKIKSVTLEKRKTNVVGTVIIVTFLSAITIGILTFILILISGGFKIG